MVVDKNGVEIKAGQEVIVHIFGDAETKRGIVVDASMERPTKLGQGSWVEVRSGSDGPEGIPSYMLEVINPDACWFERVRQWAIDRNLVKGSNPVLQMNKLHEEVQELSDAISSGNLIETMDAIGDIQVVLAVMCAQIHLDIDQCREIAWEEIKDRKGRMVDGIFVKEA